MDSMGAGGYYGAHPAYAGQYDGGPHEGWSKGPSALCDDDAPSARLVVPPGAQAAPMYPRAQPEHLGSLHLASGARRPPQR